MAIIVGGLPVDAAGNPILMLDWLELTAFFDGARARLDALANDLQLQAEHENENNGDEDAEGDQWREAIEQEFDHRTASLGDAYPFTLSDDGEELLLKPRGARSGACFYLACLIISHFTRSPILKRPPSDADDARKTKFQIIATLALAGEFDASAISFGWPRASKETIKQALDRFVGLAGTGEVRAVPGQEASRFAKDGGMDVIGWRTAINHVPPPTALYYGQAASGHGWAKKSALDEADQFSQSFFIERPAVHPHGATVVPFRLLQTDHDQWSRRHGTILDRLRAPRAAKHAILLAKETDLAIDEVGRAVLLNFWIFRYRREALAA